MEIKRLRREQELQELKLMVLEDAASMAFEKVLRSDLEAQRKLEEKRQERLRQERERKIKHWNKCAAKIQKIVRGVFSRVRTKIKKCEIHLERAISCRDEEELIKAIQITQKMNVKSKVIKEICQNARILLTTVQGELYIKMHLDQAVQTRSDELIRDAIKLAEDAGMTYLEEYSRAKQSFDKEVKRRSVIQHIQVLLDRCSSIPNLVKNADKLNELVTLATVLSLSGEYIVQDARNRLNRIQSLIKVRNDIRYAVELCSAKMMQDAMQARHKLLKIYGSEFCAEEAHAVLKMSQMYAHEEEIAMTADESSSNGVKSENSAPTDENAEATCEEKDSRAGDDNNEAESQKDTRRGSVSDVRMPPFVRKQLDLIREAQTAEGKGDILLYF